MSPFRIDKRYEIFILEFAFGKFMLYLLSPIFYLLSLINNAHNGGIHGDVPPRRHPGRAAGGHQDQLALPGAHAVGAHKGLLRPGQAHSQKGLAHQPRRLFCRPQVALHRS